ncbi:MAG TPA: hypothetical protein VFC78_01685 [Tepidisphaeraceae bacterium]|nr:hypothetical protein [Tepidisphaeraceae bacterium]
MNAFPDELRLALVLLLNVAVLASAWRFARRRGEGGMLQAACDALLLDFLVQYAAVALPGVCGVFCVSTMSAVALVAAAILWFGAERTRDDAIFPDRWRRGASGRCVGSASADAVGPPGYSASAEADPTKSDGASSTLRRIVSLNTKHPDTSHLFLLACTLFVIGYLGGYGYLLRLIPPTATDSLVYHLPTAVQWIQTGRLGIYPTWYWNPAASYSPATGSIFMAWWMAPAANDVFVRYVQIPPLMLVFFVAARMCRVMGCGRSLAGLIAVAAALSRPLFSEAMIPKDDLYVTAFVASAVLAFTRQSLSDRLGPWRAGVALGFVLASKYTALLACPVFLFLMDAPFRARWKPRHFLIAFGIIIVMAGPWYLRNLLLTGNPLYPVDVRLAGLHWQGLFGTERDRQLRSAAGVWKMLAETYNSIPLALIVALATGWLWACVAGGRALLRDPLPRVCVIGSAATLLIFLITSPHHEVRYIFPLIVLWFAAIGMALERGLRNQRAQLAFAGALAAICVATSFNTISYQHGKIHLSFTLISVVATLTLTAALLAGLGTLLMLSTKRLRPPARYRALADAAVMAGAVVLAYINWHAYVQDYRDQRMAIWASPTAYPRQGPTWAFVDKHIPAGATIAYANTYFVYPYYGFDYRHRLVYAPTRAGLHDFVHFPRMGDRVPGDAIVETMTAVMDGDSDRATWMANLRAAGAGWLVVAKHDLDADPPELKFAGRDSRRFVKVYEDPASVVFQFDWK